MDALTICNLALRRLGAKVLTTEDLESNTTTNGLTCQAFYEPTVDEVLEQHDWSFATKRVELVESVATNNTVYNYMYVLSTDCLEVINLLDEDGNDIEDDYIIEDGSLYCNLSTCWIKYISNDYDENDFSAMFVKLLVLKLASEIAFDITSDQKLEVKFLQLYEGYLRKVKGNNTYRKKARKKGRYTWNNGRTKATEPWRK